jgi:hypothetical protein
MEISIPGEGCSLTFMASWNPLKMMIRRKILRRI